MIRNHLIGHQKRMAETTASGSLYKDRLSAVVMPLEELPQL